MSPPARGATPPFNCPPTGFETLCCCVVVAVDAAVAHAVAAAAAIVSGLTGISQS